MVGDILERRVLYSENKIAEMSDAGASSQDHAELLAMEWLTGKEFKQYSVHNRVPLRAR